MRRHLFVILAVVALATTTAIAVTCRQVRNADLPLTFKDGTTTGCATLAEDIYWHAPTIFTPAFLVTSRTKVTFNFAGHKIRSAPGNTVFLVRGLGSRITTGDAAVLEATVQTRAEYARAFQVDTSASLYLYNSISTTNYTTAVAIFDSTAEIEDLQVNAHLMDNEPRQQVVGVMALGAGLTTVGRLQIRIPNARPGTLQGQSWGFFAGPSISDATPGALGSYSLTQLDVAAHTPLDLHAFTTAGVLNSVFYSNAPADHAANGITAGFLPADNRVGAFTGQNVTIDMTAANRQLTNGLFIRTPATVTIQKLRVIGANSRSAVPTGLIHYEPVKKRDGSVISTLQTVSITDFVLTSLSPDTVAVDVLPNTYFQSPYVINTADNHATLKLTSGLINGTAGLIGVNAATGADNVQLDTVFIGPGYYWGVRGAGGSTRLSVKRVQVTEACRGIEFINNCTYNGVTYVSQLNTIKRDTLVRCTNPIIDNAVATDTDNTNSIVGGASSRTDCAAEPPTVLDPSELSILNPQRKKRAAFDPNAAQDETSPWQLMFI